MALLLRLLPDKTNIPFVKWRKIAFAFSAILIVGSIGAFFVRGLNFSVDFVGGTLIEIKTDDPVDLALARTTVSGLVEGQAVVQLFGSPNDAIVTIRQQTNDEEESGAAQQAATERVKAALTQIYPSVIFMRTEAVSAKVSSELVRAGTLSVVLALFFMLVYIWFRFEWHFSVGAVAALAHDVIATIGMFAVTQIEFNLSIIAAILTIVGYSMNDTVVVYDRIRENMRKFKKMPLGDLLNVSVNDTLSRTTMTSLTTLMALLALFFLGGEVLRGFAFAMIWGVVVGTYSSIFVAAPVLLVTGARRLEEPTQEASA